MYSSQLNINYFTDHLMTVNIDYNTKSAPLQSGTMYKYCTLIFLNISVLLSFCTALFKNFSAASVVTMRLAQLVYIHICTVFT